MPTLGITRLPWSIRPGEFASTVTVVAPTALESRPAPLVSWDDWTKPGNQPLSHPRAWSAASREGRSSGVQCTIVLAYRPALSAAFPSSSPAAQLPHSFPPPATPDLAITDAIRFYRPKSVQGPATTQRCPPWPALRDSRREPHDAPPATRKPFTYGAVPARTGARGSPNDGSMVAHRDDSRGERSEAIMAEVRRSPHEFMRCV